MEYRALGNSGLQVSVAGLGTNNMGRRLDADGTAGVIHKAIDLGINFIDTADIYGDQLSEVYIGQAIKGRRHDVVIATKFGGASGPGPHHRGASRRYIMYEVEQSLRRLDTDYIDLYQIHFWDPATPIDETMRALDDLVHRGDVRYIGCSNFTAWQIVEAQWTARTEHLTPFISAQNNYSLLNRAIEAEVAPVCQRYGMSVIPYSPLAGGFLTGKYRLGEPGPPGARLTDNPGQGQRLMTEANFATLARLEAFAAARDHTMLDLALAWLGSQPFVATVIAGAMTPAQLEENARAFAWRLTPEEMREVDELVGGPPTSGQRRGPGASRS